MKQICPSCGALADIGVIESRPVDCIDVGEKKLNVPNGVRRRRECPACGSRWTTYELTADQLDEMVRIIRAFEILKS